MLKHMGAYTVARLTIFRLFKKVLCSDGYEALRHCFGFVGFS